MARRGALIVFEGCDRSGKTTQCKKIVDALRNAGKNVEFMRFPDRTTQLGKIISSYLNMSTNLDDHMVHLLFSANRWELVPHMKKLMDSGTTLIVDRYAYSGVAFTAAKPAFSLSWCRQPDVGLPRPDAVIYLDLNMEEIKKRGEFGGERYEQIEFQQKVAENFIRLKDDSWQIIDANKSIEDLHTELLSVVQKVMVQPISEKLKQLWIDDTTSQQNGEH